MSDSRDPRDRRFIAAAALIGLIVVAGILVVAIRLLGGGDQSGDGAAPRPGVTGSASTSAGSPSACGVLDGSQDVPTVAPATEWSFFGKVAVPHNPEIGPVQEGTAASPARCFAHSPAGALFAAATLAGDIFPRNDRTKAALRARAVPGPALDETLQEDLGPPGPVSQLVGFRFEDYTNDRATVTLAAQVTEGPNAGAIGATPMTLVWREGDWYLQLQASSEPIVLTSLEGFVKWSGVA